MAICISQGPDPTASTNRRTAGRLGGARILPPTGQTAVPGIAIDSRNGDLYLAGATPNGVYKSTDGGATWGARISPPTGQTVVTDIAVDSGLLTTVTANAGPDVSVDAGDTVQIGGADTITQGSGATVISWSRVSGQGGSLDSTTSATPTFTAPTLARGLNNRPIRWRKTVSNNGQEGFRRCNYHRHRAAAACRSQTRPRSASTRLPLGQEGTTVVAWRCGGQRRPVRRRGRIPLDGQRRHAQQPRIVHAGLDAPDGQWRDQLHDQPDDHGQGFRTLRPASRTSDTATDSVSARVVDVVPPVTCLRQGCSAAFPAGTAATLTASLARCNVSVGGTATATFRTGAAQTVAGYSPGACFGKQVKASDAATPMGSASLFIAVGCDCLRPRFGRILPDATATLTSFTTIPFAGKGSANFPAQTVVLGRTLPLPVAGKDSADFPAGSCDRSRRSSRRR